MADGDDDEGLGELPKLPGDGLPEAELTGDEDWLGTEPPGHGDAHAVVQRHGDQIAVALNEALRYRVRSQ